MKQQQVNIYTDQEFGRPSHLTKYILYVWDLLALIFHSFNLFSFGLLVIQIISRACLIRIQVCQIKYRTAGRSIKYTLANLLGLQFDVSTLRIPIFAQASHVQLRCQFLQGLCCPTSTSHLFSALSKRGHLSKQIHPTLIRLYPCILV